jgi:hypothetical protein
MKIISFAWTTPALLARQKSVTRRQWKPEYACRFKSGDICLAYDKQPRYGGKPIAKIRLICDPYEENSRDIPWEDYIGEGFVFLTEKKVLVDGLAPSEVWKAWKLFPRMQWVIRFEIVELL